MGLRSRLPRGYSGLGQDIGHASRQFFDLLFPGGQLFPAPWTSYAFVALLAALTVELSTRFLDIISRVGDPAWAPGCAWQAAPCNNVMPGKYWLVNPELDNIKVHGVLLARTHQVGRRCSAWSGSCNAGIGGTQSSRRRRRRPWNCGSRCCACGHCLPPNGQRHGSMSHNVKRKAHMCSGSRQPLRLAMRGACGCFACTSFR